MNLEISPKNHIEIETIKKYFPLNVVPPYPTRSGARTESGDIDQFYHIYIFKYCRNKCRLIISVKEGSLFYQLTL